MTTGAWLGEHYVAMFGSLPTGTRVRYAGLADLFATVTDRTRNLDGWQDRPVIVTAWPNGEPPTR